MSPDELVFRDYRPDDKETILALLAGGRAAGYAQEKLAVFDWQFFGNPQAAGRSPFIVGTVNNDIVAINGLMPVSARAGGEVITACWSLDTYVSGNHRGRGFGKSLIERVTVSAPVMLGFGISDMSDPIFAKCKWLLDESMTTMFYHCAEVGLKGLPKNIMTRCLRLLRSPRGDHGARLAIEAGVPAQQIDALWAGVQAQYPNAVERNGAYLSWRYGQAPLLRYRWVVARQNGQVRAILITRHHPVESVVVDYVGPLDEPALLSGLIGLGAADLAASGTRRIRCEANHPAVLAALLAAGFRRYHKAGRFRVRSNLAAGALSGKWFIMTGDSDNDLLALDPVAKAP